MKGITQVARILLYGGATVALMFGTLKMAVPAFAGELEAELIVGTASGVPGGTASVVISLANDEASAGVSADLDIAYPDDLVEFLPPVADNCRVADRIASTHQVGGTVPQPGLLRFAIFNPTGLEPLGNGEIATCDFHVLPGVPVGTAALNVDFAELTGADGMIPVVGVNGAIIISEATPTFTPTDTPILTPPTNTATPTGTVSATRDEHRGAQPDQHVVGGRRDPDGDADGWDDGSHKHPHSRNAADRNPHSRNAADRDPHSRNAADRHAHRWNPDVHHHAGNAGHADRDWRRHCHAHPDQRAVGQHRG